MPDIFDQIAAPPTPPPAQPPAQQQAAAAPVSGDVFDQIAPTPPATAGGDESYFDAVKRRATLHGVGERLSDLGTGLRQGFDSAMLGIEHGIQNHIGNLPGLSSAIASDSGAISRTTPTDPERARNVSIGSDLESLLEFMGGEAVVGKAGEALGVVDKLKKVGEIGKLMERFPGLAKVLGAATKQGITGAGMAAAHGGDTGDVIESGLTTGIVGGVMEGIPVATKNFVDKRAPTTRTIEGVTVPTLRSQDADATKAATNAAKIGDNPDYQAAQQQGGQQAIGNMAQRATRDVLQGINQGRTQPETNPARLLSAPEDSQPPTFTLNSTEPVETVQQPSSEAARPPQDAGTRQVDNPNYRAPESLDQDQIGGIRQKLGVGEAELPTAAFTGPETFKERNWQYFPPETGGGSVSRGGGGTIQSTDPHFVRSSLSQLQDLAESPSFEKLSPTQQGKINDHITSLQSQLDDYDNNAYRAGMSHFNQVDTPRAVANVTNFRDAATQIEGAVQPIYRKLDEVSGNQWSALRSQEDAQRKILRNPTTPAAYDAALSRQAEIKGKIQQIFTDNAGKVSPEELRAANGAWRMASTAKDLHATIESTMNGITPDVAARTGIDRTMKGGTPAYKRLSQLLTKRGADVKELIGQDGVDNLYRVADLLKTPEKAQGLGKLLQNVSVVLRRHGVGVGAVIGGTLAHGLGGAFGHAVPATYGLLAGAAGEAMYRRVVNEVATNPKIAQRVSYAVKNGVSDHVAAPIIAMMMTSSLKDQQQQEEKDKAKP